MRATPSLPADRRYVIYRWLSSDNFLLYRIIPGATIIDATVNDRVEDVVSQIPEDAAAFHFHLNCTLTERFPSARGELIEHLRNRGILPINDRLTDISKRAIQRQCAELGLNSTSATPDGDQDELIIVKSDLNFGGDSEWALSTAERSMLGIAAGSDIIWTPDHYRVVPRREVHASWWTDPSLACEKYVANRHNRWYRVHFFLSHLVIRELVCEDKIKKVGQSITVGQWNIYVPDIESFNAVTDFPRQLVMDLIRFARAFAVDFGAIDVMVNDDGEAFIIDVNTTPSMLISRIGGVAEYLRAALSAER